jgi:N-acetyl sugar amidotransferase
MDKPAIRYCVRCVLPNTKPDLFIDDEGVCSACRYYDERAEINWGARFTQLRATASSAKALAKRRGSSYDCLIPVSGGKDSHAQVLTALELALRPLLVTATTCHLSELGRRNLDNIKSLGADAIEVSPDIRIRRKLNRIGLETVGDISWPEHVAIFTIPIRVAVDYRIPLIIWGENSQREYGGPKAAADKSELDETWLPEYGGLLGLRPSDLIDLEGITERDLAPYTYPTAEEIKRVGIRGLFLGHYTPWSGEENAIRAKRNGFSIHPNGPVEGSYFPYENLDNLHTGIHDYFKYLKYGYGRAADQVSLAIRRGDITREEGAEFTRLYDGRFPYTYLGSLLVNILEPLGLTLDEFVDIADNHTSVELFLTNPDGSLLRETKASSLNRKVYA